MLGFSQFKLKTADSNNKGRKSSFRCLNSAGHSPIISTEPIVKKYDNKNKVLNNSKYILTDSQSRQKSRLGKLIDPKDIVRNTYSANKRLM